MGSPVFEEGVVKWFSNLKGWGFALRHTGEDVFIHYSTLQEEGFRSLREGQRIYFMVAPSPRGLWAPMVFKSRESMEQALANGSIQLPEGEDLLRLRAPPRPRPPEGPPTHH